MSLSHEVFYDFFYNNATPQLLIKAENGLILEANAAACAYYGAHIYQDQATFLHNLDTFPPAVSLAELNLAANGLEHTHRSTHKTSIGLREVELRSTVATAEALLLTTVHDITDQVSRERTLSADEERWRSALGGSGDGIWDWDLATGEVFSSRRWIEMLGYGYDEIGQSLKEWQALVCSEDAGRVASAYEKLLNGDCTRVELEYCMHCKDGSRMWILDRCTLLRWDTEGKPARIISVHSDITSRMKNESQLRSFNDDLEKLVIKRTEALNLELTVREESERQLRAYQDRLAALAEELCVAEERERRRLAIWLHDDVGQNLALLKILLDRMGKRSNSELERITEMSELLASTIGGIREHTMLISPPLLESLGLIPAISKLANDIGSKYGFSVNIEERQTLPNMPLALRSALYRIIKELLVNIVKHAEASRVDVVVTCDATQIGFSVSDDGRGFNVEGLEATESANNSFGLFHVRQRLSQLGGTFEVHSSPGHGTVSAFFLPCQRGDERAAVDRAELV